MRFMRRPLGLTQRDKVRSEEIEKKKKTEHTNKKVYSRGHRKYQNNWQNHLKRRAPKWLP